MLLAQLGKVLAKPTFISALKTNNRKSITCTTMASTRQVLAASYNTNKIGNKCIFSSKLRTYLLRNICFQVNFS